MDLKKLKRLHDKAFNHGQTTRRKAADDLIFYWVTQWDDNLLQGSQLAYRGEFDILRKAGRQILADLIANKVSLDFEPKYGASVDASDLADGLYRTSEQNNRSVTAFKMSKQDAMVCGVGAWQLFTEYENTAEGAHQVIRRRPIPEANNVVFWDPNAKEQDKSDADHVSVLFSYSEDGYKALHEELTGEKTDLTSRSFAHPDSSFVFPWIIQDKRIFVVCFYRRKLIKDKILTLRDPFGQEKRYLEKRIAEFLPRMKSMGYQITKTVRIKRYEVTKYTASGEKILKEQVIAGEHLPIIPMYGERAFVEGEEHYEGVTRLAKDPQRLRNFQMSYLADIVSKSPRIKPIFNAEQIQGYEDMYNEAGADNNFPYYLQNRLAATGEPLPIGPIAMMPEQPIPSALIQSIALSKEAVEDVANPALPQNISDPDISGKAIYALQSMLNKQSAIYQDGYKIAIRRDGEVWASMAKEVMDTPRVDKLTSVDGTRRDVEMMKTTVDPRTGQPVVTNDMSGVDFEVFATLAPSYESDRRERREELMALMATMGPQDPLREILMLEYITLSDGESGAHLKSYARKQLLIKGIMEPESEEEAQMVKQAIEAQANKKDAAMVMAEGEWMKGKANMLKEEREGMTAEEKALVNRASVTIDGFDAETRRMDANTRAHKADADIHLGERDQQIDEVGKRIDNTVKLLQFRGSAQPVSSQGGGPTP
jgi:hypothetical protein